MLDRQGRKRTARAMAGFMRGRIDNFKLDAIFFSQDSADRTLTTIHKTLWRTYDDVKRHPISINQQGWKAYRRCIAFLNTDYQLPLYRSEQSKDEGIWPFQRTTDIFSARPQLKRYAIPRFDAAVHNRPIRGILDAKIPWWVFPLLLALFVGYILLVKMGR